jgi:hypothetical protein
MGNTKGSTMTDTSISYGSKYQKDLGVVAIAKLVRIDIRAAIKAGNLPKGLKCSVRIDRYSMGQSLDVTVKACPGACPLDATGFPRRDDATLALLRTIVAAYNFDGSDLMSDYYHVNFSSSVSYCHELRAAWREGQAVSE